MRPGNPLPDYPVGRRIVYAGFVGRPEQITAFRNREVGAWMSSYLYVRQGKRARNPNKWRDILAQLDWPHYRYLDSGAFTFLRRGKATRLKRSGKTIAVEKKRDEEKSIVTLKEVMDHFQAYMAYLEENLDQWDFIFDMDVDTLTLDRGDQAPMPGREFADWARGKLQALAGNSYIPVWHSDVDDHQGFPMWHDFISRFAYVAIGSGQSPTWRPLKDLCDAAHSAGTMVHGLGTSRADILRATPFDTVDSSTWLSAEKFGAFAGFLYPAKQRGIGVSLKELSRSHHAFEPYVRALGINPEDLVNKKKRDLSLTVALALFQDRERAAPPIPRPTIRVPLKIGKVSVADESF